MSTRARHWLVIIVAAGIPLLVLFTATRSFETPTKLDPRFPAKCTAIYRQATNNDLSGAAKSATTLLVSSASSVEEQICAQAALKALVTLGTSATPVDLDLSTGDRCAVATAFDDQGAQPAALEVYQVLSGSGGAGEKACGVVGARRLTATPVQPSPKCGVVARLFVLGPAKAASDAMSTALADDATTIADTVCLANVAAAVQTLTPAEVRRPSAAFLEPTLAPLCLDAASEARAGDIARARATYERQLKLAKNPDAQACAVGGIARLSAEDTFADWSFAQANRVSKRLTNWIPGGPLLFAEGSKNAVVAIFWFLLLGLVIVGLRQLIRWRRERWPGPVAIQPVQGAATSDANTSDTVDVAEVVRHNLSRAGIYEHAYTGGVGALLVDVSAALGASGDTGMVGKFINAVKDAVTIKAGYEMTVHADHDAEDPDGEYQLVIELSDAQTTNTWNVQEYSAASDRKVAEIAAFETYRRLFAREEVRRRTASFLSWTSCAGLIAYHEAVDLMKGNKYRKAVSLLDEAAKNEPANLLVQLLMTHCYQTLAEGTPTDNALRGPSEVGDDYLKAMGAALRAVLLNRFSEEAHGRLAIVLGYVGRWKGAWANNPPGREITDLLAELGDLPPDSVLLDPNDSAFEIHFLKRAEAHWRTSERCTWWPIVLWVAWHLDRRRTVAGEIWPFHRGRKSTHDLLLAADLKTRYDRFVRDSPTFVERALAAFHLVRVRFGRLLWLRRIPKQEGNVQYNLAAAYVGRATYLNGGSTGPLNQKANKTMGRALKALQRSYAGTGRVLRRDDLDMVSTDPDFYAMGAQAGYGHWVSRFGSTDAVEIAKHEWRELFSTLADRADAASRSWYDHLEQPVPSTRRWNDNFATWASEALAWIGEDLQRWTALSGWLDRPAGTAVKEAFVQSIKDPKINDSRPFRNLETPKLPGDDKNDVSSVRESNSAAFASFQHLVGTAVRIVENDLDTALRHVAARDASTFDSHFADVARKYAQMWSSLALWATHPPVRHTEVVGWFVALEVTTS